MKRQTKIGKVISDKMDKSVVVEVERTVLHPRYQRYIKRRSRFMAHDEANACNIGDQVQIIEHRPISKRKRWKVQATLSAAATV